MLNPRDDPDRRRSRRLLGVDPNVENDRDDNPPPPGESQLDLSQSLLSPPTPPVDSFTVIDRAHEGRSTTSPRDAVPPVIFQSPVLTQNQFEQLGQQDDATTVSEDIIAPPLGEYGDDAVSTTPSTARALEDLARTTDDTIAEINAIPASSPVFSNDLHRLEQSIVAKITTIETTIGTTMSSLFSELQQSLAFTTKELIADITSMNTNMKLFKDRVDNDHISVTAALATLSSNTARLSEETSALSVRVVEHQGHLENLLGFEEARQAQMDDHWKSISALTSQVEEVSATAATQTQRLVAQLDGIRSNNETATTALKNDMTDLRGRIIPSLREQSSGIALSVKRLEERFENYAKAKPPATPTPISDIPSPNTPPLRHPSPVVTDPQGERPDPNSWYSRPTTVRFDNPAAAGPRANPYSANVRPTPISTAAYSDDGDDALLVGGRITSPRSTDKERQARKLRISRHDVANLACYDYHGGPLGVKELTLQFIHACGYQSFATDVADDILPCYGQIQLLHKKVRQAWFNPRTLQSGPSVDRILEKGLTVLPKLRDTDAKGTVEFYERFQHVSAAYLIPLMPFDAICLRNNYEGLFPPGLGTDAYAECCAAVLEVLPRLLPLTNTEVVSLVSAVSNASRNGYDLLWRILELFVPGFDPTVPIAQPTWSRDSTILEFCQSHLLYFRLQAKKNVFFSARDRTNIFLRAVAPSEYADIVTTIMTSVDTYRHPDDDGHLPDQFRLNEIAMLIHTNAKHRIRDIHTPRINRMTGPPILFDDNDDFCDPLLAIQGYHPRVNRVDRPSDRSPTGLRPQRYGDRYGDRGKGQHDGGDRGKGPPVPTQQGRYNRPDQRRRPFQQGVQCAACKRLGHEAANCDMLAIALFIDRYTKQDLSATDKDALEQQWLKRWKEKLGMPARTPRQIMRTYCDTQNITEDLLDQAMDWECWPESDLPDQDST